MSMAAQVVVLVGTSKGAFIFYSEAGRREWRRTGPHLAGWEIYSLLGVPLPGEGARVFAGTSHLAYGPTIRVSQAPIPASEPGLGEAWTQLAGSPRFPKESGATVKRIWQIVPGAEPETYFAGVEDAGLFGSRDGGVTWEEVEGLNWHPSRATWQRTKGGLALHSIVVDPADARRMWVAISGAGIFRTLNGGETWEECRVGLPRPDDSGTARLNHKLVADPRDADTLYLQHFDGLYRSDDGGETWRAIGEGLPSRFGFPLAVTAAGDLFAVPLENAHERYMVAGKLRLYRSRDRGDNWEPVSAGLPEHPSYVAVLRDALAVDPLEPTGVYFGTTAGELFCSSDAGDTWQALPGQYSRITCVKTMVVTGRSA